MKDLNIFKKVWSLCSTNKYRMLWIPVLLASFILVARFFSKIYTIYNQDLTYNENLGWVDWGHAKTEGTDIFLEKIFQLVESKNEVDTLMYSQSMRLLTVKMKLQKRFIISSLSETDKLNVAYAIFQSVSNDFEKMQAKYPIAQFSAFTQEDSNGNKISFYCAAKRMNSEIFKSEITALPFLQTVFLYLKSLIIEFNPSENEVKNDFLKEFYQFYDDLEKQKKQDLQCVESSELLSF